MSCGGGGSGSAVSSGSFVSSGVAAVLGVDLLITEVSAKANSFGAEGGWFEVYNPSSKSIDLADYLLASTAFNSTTVLTSASFTLPAATIPAGGFLILASTVATFLPDGPQLKYIGSPSLFPSWNASGFLELKRTATSQVADFVRFGSNSAVPSGLIDWMGVPAAALPTGTLAYGKSLVRLASGGYADTNSAIDWTVVNFSTPGGKNDVAPGVVDTDGDGVPSSAKLAGSTYAGLDLYSMGARPGQRDVFLEIHAMDQADGAKPEELGFVVRKKALQKVVDAFTAKGINLHIDAGARFSSMFDPSNFNLGGGNAPGTIAFRSFIDLPIIGVNLPVARNAAIFLRQKIATWTSGGVWCLATPCSLIRKKQRAKQAHQDLPKSMAMTPRSLWVVLAFLYWQHRG